MAENKEKIETKPQQSSIDELFGFFDRASLYVVTTYKRLMNMEKTNMEIGIRQLKRGEFFDAALRFKIVLFLNKNNAIAHYLLGKSYFFRGKPAKAPAPLQRALTLKPDLEEAKFLLAACGKPTDIKAMPRSFIIEKLDYMSLNYDNFINNISSHLQPVLKEDLFKIIRENMGFNVIDLGCRGGDAAENLRHVANAVVGVEPSLKMVALARARRIENLLAFNLLVTKFPEDYLRDCKDKFAVALSTYYMDNLGDLSEYFRLVHNVLESGGLFAFNISKHEGPQDYVFKPSSLIFMHSETYVKRLAETSGFTILSATPLTYPNEAVDLVFVLEKK